jgi:thiol-disulfide isomerase/thioredoxin
MRQIILGIAMFLTSLWSPMELTAEAAGAPAPALAPAFELVTFAGESYSNVSLGGRPILLVFWAPWCKVCQRELPALTEWYQRDRPEKVGIVSIGFADTRTNVERFVKERPGMFIYPTAYDEDRWVAQAFKVNATPTYVLLDAQGSMCDARIARVRITSGDAAPGPNDDGTHDIVMMDDFLYGEPQSIQPIP